MSTPQRTRTTVTPPPVPTEELEVMLTHLRLPAIRDRLDGLPEEAARRPAPSADERFLLPGCRWPTATDSRGGGLSRNPDQDPGCRAANTTTENTHEAQDQATPQGAHQQATRWTSFRVAGGPKAVA